MNDLAPSITILGIVVGIVFLIISFRTCIEREATISKYNYCLEKLKDNDKIKVEDCKAILKLNEKK